MSFSRLLLVAANSKKYINGEGNDTVRISPKLNIPGRDAYEGEVILCFQLDDKRSDPEKQIPLSLGISDDSQRCDGLVFYAEDEKADRVICLVEMKSTNVSEAPKQIIATRERIERLLQEECNLLPGKYGVFCRKQLGRIVWKACLYHSGSSLAKVADIQKELKNNGFQDVIVLDRANNDLRPGLRGERNAKEMGKKFKHNRR